jgi:hypothetical protein
MNSLKSITPRTQLAQYNPNQEINFELLHDGEALKAKTIYMTAKLVMVGADRTDEHYYDNFAGVSSLFENVNTRCDLFQEVISNYGRLNKMKNALMLSPDQMASGLKNSSEMLCHHLSKTPTILASAVAPNNFSFAHFFNFGLNQMTGDLDSAKSGKINISFKLVSPQKCFFGGDSAALNYYLTDIELHYMTVPVGSPSVSIRIVEDTQKLIQTSNTTIANTFVNPIDGVLVSFSTVDSENEQTQNTLACQNPTLAKMSWVYNDMSNQLVSYEIESQEEQLLSGFYVMDSMGCGVDLREKIALAAQDGIHSMTDKFIVGLNIGQLMDFSRSGLGLNVRIDNLTENYYAHFYGFGQKQLF